MPLRTSSVAVAGLLLLVTTVPAVRADHHTMQIHKAIGGLNGFTDVQAIQLRMRQSGQGVLTGKRVYAWDAAGSNPVLLVTCDHDVANDAGGARIVIATDNFSICTSPPTEPDFVMENRIPDEYLPAGSLTWENELGTVWWRLCWGGASYTGPTNMNGLNDPDLTCEPPWDGAMPSTTLEALRFEGSFFATGTSSLDDYSIAPGAATFTTNGGLNTVLIAPPTSVQVVSGPIERLTAAPNPFHAVTRLAFHLARRGSAEFSVLDLTGRLVMRQEATLEPGERTFEWRGVDGSGKPVPAGVYFLRLEVGEESRGVPVVLVR